MLRSTEGTRSARRRRLLGDVRTRILVSFLILLVVSTAASLFVLREVLMSRIGTEVQERLTSQVDELRTMAERRASADTSPRSGDLERLFSAYLKREQPLDDGALATFIDGARFTSEPAGFLPGEFDSLADAGEPVSGERGTPLGTARYVAVPVSGRGETGVLVASKLLRDERDQVESAIRIAAGVAIVITLLAALFIWLAAGRAVEPLRALARTTRSITETDLSDRVEVRGEGEIAELGRTFNRMLDHLEEVFASQKAFLADVGHELRTPITVIRGQFETAGDDPDERRATRAVINEELERMSRLVDDLLLLARSDRPDFLRTQPLDLDVLTHDLFDKARTLGVRRWILDQADVGLVHADPHRLTSAVMNLAQNAVRHTGGDEAIAIGSSLSDAQARVWVRDEGEGIPAADQERIFERFAAANGSVAHGAGLGLAIVKAIAEAHGGRVELESKPGEGSRFTIVIPSDAPPPEVPRSPWPES